ncbi:helix-turn-helix domain-containing protein [Enterococcus gilvus]|uniref:helix-turn-helix domain-containing protein n=1 Tax=Enterococcus gilvus TaxID=160453 RepID=UPI0028D842F5|nr:helix-turn-helix domain-containing protein [Enterococcus gilvus]
MIPNYLKKELNILFYVVRRKHTSLSEIAQTLDISKRTVKEDVIKINMAFSENFSVEDFFISNSSGVITVNSVYRFCALEYAYRIKLKLLQTNVLFNVCVQLTTHSQIDKEELLNKLYVSEHYLAKINQQLNDYFKVYNISIANTGGIYSLKGDELSVRLFSYIFLQDAFQEIEWPFDDLNMTDIKNKVPFEILDSTEKKLETKKRALYILYGILETRISAQNFIKPPFSQVLVDFFELIRQSFDVDIIFHRESFGFLNTEDKKVEILYFNFLSRIFIPYIFSRKQKVELGEIFFNSDHPYCLLSKKIYFQLSYLFNGKTSNENKALSMYYITIFNAWYFLVGDDYLHLLDLYLPQINFHVPYSNKYYKLINKAVSKIVKKGAHTEFISNMIYWFYISERKSTLEIYLQLIKDFSAEYYLKNRLSFLYNENTIAITDDYSTADIIITDTFESSTTDKEIFYLDSIEDEEGWSELTELIQKKYLEKLNQF